MNEFVVPVVAIIATFSFLIAKHYFRFKSNQGASSVETDRLQQEVQALKQRVAALEAIVTDPGYQLKRDIERL
jgi:hypothetical protein